MTLNEIRSYLGAVNGNAVCGKPPGTLLIVEAAIHGRAMPPDGCVVRDGVTFKAEYKADGWDHEMYLMNITGERTSLGRPYRRRHIPDTLDVVITAEAGT